MFYSIIVAIYNVEPYIRNGIQQLLNQQFQNFEIILSDDGSTDGSANLCDEVSTLDSRIKVIHGKNAGAGEARNRAIKIAQGEYICFFDIDDCVSPMWLSTIYVHLSKYAPDVLEHGYREINPFYKSSVDFSFKDKRYLSNAEIKNDYVDEFLGLRFNNGFVWNKMFKRAFIEENNLAFENQRIQQDEVFNLLTLPKIKSMITISDCLYYYYIYSSGNTRSGFIADRLDVYRSVRDHFMKLYDEWGINDERMLAYVYNRFFNSLLEYINFNIYHPKAPYSRNERCQILLDLFNAPDIRHCLEKMGELNIVPASKLKSHFYKAILDKNVNKYNAYRVRLKLETFMKTHLSKLYHKISHAETTDIH